MKLLFILFSICAFQSTDDFNQQLDRPNTEVRIPAGTHTVTGLGQAITGKDWGTATIIGQGRASTFKLDPSVTDHGIVNHTDQGSWHDGNIERVAFQGNGNGKTLLDISGYSLSFRDIFIRSTNQNGLRIFNGQHFVLDNVQTEGMKVGIHLDNIFDATLTGCNVESCDVGILITKTHGDRGRLININKLYAEKTNVAIRAINSQFRLTGGVYISDRQSNKAVDLLDCSNCYIDMSQGCGRVFLNSRSHNNEIIVSINDQVRVQDRGFGNTVRTLRTPTIVLDPDMTQKTVVKLKDDKYFRHEKVYEILESDSEATFRYQYKVSKQVNLYVEFYDVTNKEFYDFKTQAWKKNPPFKTYPLAWITNQACTEDITIKIGGVDREIQARLVATRGKDSELTIYKIDKLED